MTKLKGKHHRTTPDISAPLFNNIHAKKCSSNSFPFSWVILRHFYHRSTACLQDPLGRWSFSTQVCIGTYAHLYLGTPRGSAEVTPKPGHRCHTPAGQLELLSLSTAGCRRDNSTHKGPLWTVYKTSDHFYFWLLNTLCLWRPVWVTTLKCRLPFKLEGWLHFTCQ